MLSTSGHDLSEETSQIDSGIRSLQGDDSDLLTDISPSSTSVAVVSTGAIRKMDSSAFLTGSRFLAPLDKRSGSSNLMHFLPLESTRHKRFEVTNYTTNSPLPSPSLQIDLGFKDESKLDQISSNLDNLSSTTTIKGFTLSGKGAMFLKTNTNKNTSSSDMGVKVSSNQGENIKRYKSILRDTSLTDVRNRPESKISDHEIEDRKIVRFNFAASEESSGNEAEHDAWDFAEANSFVKDIKVTVSKNNAQAPTSTSAEPKISGKSLTSIFDHKMEQDWQIKPLYEDTDSESIASVKNSNRKLKEFGSTKLAMPHGRESANLKAQLVGINDIVDLIRESESGKKKDLESDENELDVYQQEIRDLEIQHNVSVEQFKQQLKKEFEEKHKTLTQESRTAEEKLQQNHKIMLSELERDLKSEEELIKKDHAAALIQLREKITRELELETKRMRETGENRLYEKLRCEKRLLEDKYRCLKDKYIRLKTDVKISLERRNQRRELQCINNVTEIDRSHSNKNSVPVQSKIGDIGKPPALLTPRKSRESSRDKTQDRERIKNSGSAAKNLSHMQQYQEDTTSISQSDTTISNERSNHLIPVNTVLSTPLSNDNGNSDSETLRLGSQEANNNRDGSGRQRKKLFSRMKSASTSRLNSAISRGTDTQTPVENLRRQLQKLDDLEDQFPENTLDTAYHLRYPFKVDNSREQSGGSCSELEFFKHRIHLERDSVRRAKDSLRSQRTNFRARQREIEHRNVMHHSVDQMIQQEKEMTEMEVDMHRTRALLGEKVIRLRHLEQSLQCIYANGKPLQSHLINEENCSNREDATISDISSHSSSGFSSTDLASDTHHGNGKRKAMFQESTKIIHSLENLNAEIREIWEILSKQKSVGNIIVIVI